MTGFDLESDSQGEAEKKERKTTASGQTGEGMVRGGGIDERRHRAGWHAWAGAEARAAKRYGRKGPRESAQPCFRPFNPILNYQSHNLATK